LYHSLLRCSLILVSSSKKKKKHGACKITLIMWNLLTAKERMAGVVLPYSPVTKPTTVFKIPTYPSANLRIFRPSKISCDCSCFEVKDISYQSPGTKLIAGLSSQNQAPSINNDQSPELLLPGRVGIVFQFPERYFVADNVLDEIIFGWPRQRGGVQLRELLASRLERAMTSVGLTGISLDKDPQSLSGGYKRRLALAIYLVQIPALLILDEPLAGLDWKASADVVKLLKKLKKELTLLVVSHDLEELASLVDQSWRMETGVLKSELLPI